MRPRRAACLASPLLAAALLATAAAVAAGPSVVVLDWREGRFALGAPAALEGVSAASWPITVDPCHREVYADALYAPEGAGASVELAEAQARYPVRVVVAGENWTLAAPVHASGYGHFVGVAPAAGNATATLHLQAGWDVAWELRLRGWAVDGEPACDAS